MPNDRLRLPSHSRFAKLLNTLGNSVWLAKERCAILSKAPLSTLESDVVDASSAIPCSAVQQWVPNQVETSQTNGHTVLTIVSDRHGHLGPRFLGPLRKRLPSPLQSHRLCKAIGGCTPHACPVVPRLNAWCC